MEATGALASIEDVTLGAAFDVVAQNITSTYGTVALVSSQGAVTASEINGGIDVAISANQDVTTSKINSLEGTVVLNTEQGKVTTTGDLTTNGGEVYVSSVGDVVIQNIISNGGAITIASEQGAVTTGFLRSDNGNGSGGKIYVHVQATGSFLATASVPINGTNYSIYTGTNTPGWVSIIYGSGVTVAFDINSTTTTNGTVADVSPQPIFSFKPTPTKPGVWGLVLLIFEIILDAGPAGTPTSVEVINPITGKPYQNDQERELVEQLTERQQQRLQELIYDKTKKQSLREEDLSKGQVETSSGCFYFELDRHLGGYGPHNVYATWVTGSKGDFLIVAANKVANYAFYDGEVKEKGRAFTLNFEPLGSLAEVKTAQYYLIKAAKGQELSPQEQHNKQVLELELYYRNLVAQLCGRKFFLSFDTKDVAQAAISLYKAQYPNVEIHYIKPGYPSNVYDP